MTVEFVADVDQIDHVVIGEEHRAHPLQTVLPGAHTGCGRQHIPDRRQISCSTPD